MHRASAGRRQCPEQPHELSCSPQGGSPSSKNTVVVHFRYCTGLNIPGAMACVGSTGKAPRQDQGSPNAFPPSRMKASCFRIHAAFTVFILIFILSRTAKNIPGLSVGDEVFYSDPASCSSIGSHMGQQCNITGRFFLLFFHQKRLPSMHIGGIIPQKVPFVDTRNRRSENITSVTSLQEGQNVGEIPSFLRHLRDFL